MNRKAVMRERVFLALGFLFTAMSWEITKALIAGILSINLDPSRDIGAAISGVFFVCLAIYERLGENLKRNKGEG